MNKERMLNEIKAENARMNAYFQEVLAKKPRIQVGCYEWIMCECLKKYPCYVIKYDIDYCLVCGYFIKDGGNGICPVRMKEPKKLEQVGL